MRRPEKNQLLLWVALLYLIQGWPFGLIQDVLPVLMRDTGFGLSTIGWTTALTLPWSLKWLWAPFFDRARSRRASTALFIVLCGLGIAISGWLPWSESLIVLSGMVFTTVLLSALQDTSIDGYSISFLSVDQYGMANGLRVLFFRFALIVTGGMLLSHADFLGWKGIAFISSAFLVIAGSVIHLFGPESTDSAGSVKPLPVASTFRSFFRQDRVWIVILFVFLYKLGDILLNPMIRPFWVDVKLDFATIGWLQGGVVVVTGAIGAVIGGYLTSRWGIIRALFWLGLAQAGSNLGYFWAALQPLTGRIFVAAGIEAFCGGLGTAVFLAFLMSRCQRQYAATHYALFTTLYALGRSFAGGLSGILTETMGYAGYFGLTFLFSLPGLLLIRYLPNEQDST